jgi:serine/threonine-protein kinase
MILNGLLSTLSYCHEQDIIHRDIKPENIVVRANEPKDIVLLDFGLAFNQDTQPSDFQTDPGQHIGNRFIVLPEYGVSDSDKRNKLSDVAQCTGILFFLITGLNPDNIIDEQNQQPHQRQIARDIIASHSHEVSTQLQRIFSIGFSTQFMRRWQSISALQAEVNKLESVPQGPAISFEAALKRIQDEILGTPKNQVLRRFD